jgi:molybdate transport system substrate-binding protein
MNMRASLRTLIFPLVLAFAAGSQAAEIKVLAANGLKSVLEELGPHFEKATQHKLVMEFAPAADLKARIDKGEAFDVTVLTSSLIEDLVKQGKLAPATRAAIAKAGIGVAIKRGTAKPDIATADGFKRVLLGSKSIAYVGTGITGSNMKRIFEKFGIADEMTAKTKLISGMTAADAVAAGDAELGFGQISEIISVNGVELAGPLPADIQVYTTFAGAVSVTSKHAAAAERLMKLLVAPAAVPIIKTKGMDPG